MVQWPSTSHMWGVKGVIIGGWPWNLAGAFVFYTCICVPTFMALWPRVFEKTHLGGFKDWFPFVFHQNFIYVFESSSLVFQPACSQSTIFARWWLMTPTLLALFFSWKTLSKNKGASFTTGFLSLSSMVVVLWNSSFIVIFAGGLLFFLYCNASQAQNLVRWP